MSAANALQAFVYQRLMADADLQEIIGDRVFDAPEDGTSYPYVSFGPADENPDEKIGLTSGQHSLQIDIWSNHRGFKQVKAIGGVIRKSLHEIDGDLGDAALINMTVQTVRYLTNPDGVTRRGVVSIEAEIEE